MNYIDMPVSEFTAALASSSPAPGGGGASALAAALGAALACMVGNLTVGKKKYAENESRLRELIAEAQSLRERLLALVDADAEAFLPLAAAYRLPKDAPGRDAVMEKCLADAAADAGQRIAAVPQQGVHERPVGVPRRGVHDHAARLVYDDDVPVLIHHVQRDILRDKLGILRFGQEHLKAVPRGALIILLHGLAAEQNRAVLYQALGGTARQGVHTARKESVDPVAALLRNYCYNIFVHYLNSLRISSSENSSSLFVSCFAGVAFFAGAGAAGRTGAAGAGAGAGAACWRGAVCAV